MGAQDLMGGLQSSDRLFARDRREGIEELIEAVPAFEVINEVPKRHASPNEHGSASQNIRIAVYNGLFLHSILFRRPALPL